MNKKIILCSILLIIFLISLYFTNNLGITKEVKVDLTNLKIGNEAIKTYTQDNYNTFLEDYNSNKLPEVYITEFVFDGAGMYKPYDIDDYIEEGNDYNTKVLSIKALNINTTGNIELTGKLTGMVLVNTNDIKGDINIILNGVNIDTDSKKVPAVYIYNKDIDYTKHKVTIIPKEGTENYIEGGKLKKVSLMHKNDLEGYFLGTSSEWYTKYSNYYGVYTGEEVGKVLFAEIQADNEDIKDKDPYLFYKAAGAISSDIDLYFEGKGYLKVTSKNNEGIETKGNLTFSGGVGNYEIYAEDDCLNTTTADGRNTLTIDVESLKAIVSLKADEGDAIDSNGTLTINGGNITALSHPGQDSGLDSSKGTYINGGTIIATGDMYDQILNTSKQKFIVLSFSEKVTDKITLKDNNNVIFEYETDRPYTNLIYSSANLKDGIYTLYKNDTLLGYSGTGNMRGPQPPMGDRSEPPMNNTTTNNPTNKEFTISGISNLFSGIGEYK